MNVVLFGPDEAELARWHDLPADIRYVARFADIDDGEWETIDAVLLDLQLFRVNTGGFDVDWAMVEASLHAAAARNPDAFWLLIAPPVLHYNDAAHRLARNLGNQLSGGMQATQVSTEPHRVSEILESVSSWLAEVERVNGIPVTINGVRALRQSETRCIRRLLRDCESVVCEPLGDGQSDAVVLRAECMMDGGMGPPRVLKVGPVRQIMEEHRRYLDHVRHRIGLGRAPHHDDGDLWRAGSHAAISYSFAGGLRPRALAVVMEGEGDGCDALVDLWQNVLVTWTTMRRNWTESIGEYIGAFLGQMTLDEAEAIWQAPPPAATNVSSPIPWLRDVVSRVNDVSLPRSIAHGDLHAYNVLVDDAGHAWLIDFYKTGWSRPLFDSAYLDVYLLLHRVGTRPEPVDRPSAEIVDGEQRFFAGGDPVRPELTIVRDEAVRIWGAQASALFHLARACVALRLLRYASTNASLAKDVAGLAAGYARRLEPAWEAAPEVGAIEL